MHIGDFSIFISHTLYRAFTNSSGIFWCFRDGGTSGHVHHHLISASAFLPVREWPTNQGELTEGKDRKQIYFDWCYVVIGPIYLDAQTHARTFQL